MYLRFVKKEDNLVKENVMSFYLTDYLKTITVLYDLNLFAGKIFSSENLPSLIKKHSHTLSGNDIFEIISLIDFIKDTNEVVEDIRKMDNTSKDFKAVFSNVDFSVYANKDSGIKRLIFDEYKEVQYIYNKVFEVRNLLKRAFLDINKNEIINVNLLYKELSNYYETDGMRRFLNDFEYVSSVGIAKNIKNRFLGNLKKGLFEALLNIKPIVLFNKNQNFLIPIQTISNNQRVKSCGVLSDFSNYIYFLANYEKFSKENKTYIEDLKTLNNITILEKILYLMDNNGGYLKEFLELVLDSEFFKKLVASGNINSFIKILSTNRNLFRDSLNNDDILIAYLLVEINNSINKQRDEITNEIVKIISDDIDLEYRLAELEIYISYKIKTFMNNKRIYNIVDEKIHTAFYSSISNMFREIIFECFDKFIEVTENEED